MGTFTKGEIIVINFSFSNLEQSKTRPTYIASADFEDLILYQITSRETTTSIKIKNSDFANGKLSKTSFIKINKIFTFERKKVNYKVGKMKEKKYNRNTKKDFKNFSKLNPLKKGFCFLEAYC